MNDIETNNVRVIKDANDVLRFGMAELTAYGDDQGSEEGVARGQELVGQQIERGRLLVKRAERGRDRDRDAGRVRERVAAGIYLQSGGKEGAAGVPGSGAEDGDGGIRGHRGDPVCGADAQQIYHGRGGAVRQRAGGFEANPGADGDRGSNDPPALSARE